MTGALWRNVLKIDITNHVEKYLIFFSRHYQGGESHGFNDGVHCNHGISCRYSGKTYSKINYISTDTYLTIIQLSAHTSSLFRATIHQSVFLQCVVPKFEQRQNTIFVRTCVENYSILWSNFEMNTCFE